MHLKENAVLPPSKFKYKMSNLLTFHRFFLHLCEFVLSVCATQLSRTRSTQNTKRSKHMANVIKLAISAAAKCGLWHVRNGFVLCLTNNNNNSLSNIDRMRRCCCCHTLRLWNSWVLFFVCWLVEWGHSHEHISTKPHTQSIENEENEKPAHHHLFYRW